MSDLSGPLSEALRLVDRLTRENLELAGRCGYLQSELMQARERLALEAPRVDPATVADATVEAPAIGRDLPIEPPRPWWSRWASALGF